MDAVDDAKTKKQKKAIPEPVGIDMYEDMEQLCKLLSGLEEFTQKIQADSVTSSLVISGLISIYKGKRHTDK